MAKQQTNQRLNLLNCPHAWTVAEIIYGKIKQYLYFKSYIEFILKQFPIFLSPFSYLKLGLPISQKSVKHNIQLLKKGSEM